MEQQNLYFQRGARSSIFDSKFLALSSWYDSNLKGQENILGWVDQLPYTCLGESAYNIFIHNLTMHAFHLSLCAVLLTIIPYLGPRVHCTILIPINMWATIKDVDKSFVKIFVLMISTADIWIHAALVKKVQVGSMHLCPIYGTPKQYQEPSKILSRTFQEYLNRLTLWIFFVGGCSFFCKV